MTVKHKQPMLETGAFYLTGVDHVKHITPKLLVIVGT